MRSAKSRATGGNLDWKQNRGSGDIVGTTTSEGTRGARGHSSHSSKRPCGAKQQPVCTCHTNTPCWLGHRGCSQPGPDPRGGGGADPHGVQESSVDQTLDVGYADNRGRPAVRGKRTYGGRPGQRVEEQGTWASRTQKHSEAGHGRPVDRGCVDSQKQSNDPGNNQHIPNTPTTGRR